MPSRGGGLFGEERCWGIGLGRSLHNEDVAEILLFGQSSSTVASGLLQSATAGWGDQPQPGPSCLLTHAACGS